METAYTASLLPLERKPIIIVAFLRLSEKKTLIITIAHNKFTKNLFVQ